MRWYKEIQVCGPNVVRVVCYPEGSEGGGATFAVRHPERFRRARTRQQKGQIVYRNPHLAVKIRQDGQKLAARNFEIQWFHGDWEYNWQPGMKDEENFGGPYLSLDICCDRLIGGEQEAYDPMKGFNAHMTTPLQFIEIMREHVRRVEGDENVDIKAYEEFRQFSEGKPPKRFRDWPAELKQWVKRVRRIPPGLLSRSGVTMFMDDSLPWDQQQDWIARRPKIEPQVFYIIYYGNAFKKGLGLLSELLGPVPRVPDWVLGIWFSCYRKMGETAFRKLKDQFDQHDLPLDVVVVDTDWHKHFWHGFDWNRRLFPEPRQFRDWLRQNRLHAPFNVHPQYIPAEDTRLPEFLRKTGTPRNRVEVFDALHEYNVGRHEVDLFDKKQADAYMDVFHRPIEREGGCDMWWVDGVLVDNKGRDATAWLNELYCIAGQKKRRRRGDHDEVVLSRAHGLGAHRSTLHFTGDTLSQWTVLEHQVRITPLASNSLLAYESHDIGGFYCGHTSWKQNKPPDDLMVRWTQFGCLSPIMRFHSDHGIREPWRFNPLALEIIRDFLHFRRLLQPYLRRLANEAHRTGVGLCRPMYYEFPDQEEAYQRSLQYMLGDALLVAPVTNPQGRGEMWFPPGKWRHCFCPRTVTGPCWITEDVPLKQAPIYLRMDRAEDKSLKGIIDRSS